MTNLSLLSLLALAGLAVACEVTKSVGADDPADVAGDYSVTLTNGANGCKYDGWKEGDSRTGVPLTIMQTGGNVVGKVGGIEGVVLGFGFGSDTYTGTVVGDQVHMAIYGKSAKTEGNCTYTVNSEVDARIMGDFLTGTISYVPKGNGNPDCATFASCLTQQTFNGSRPPRTDGGSKSAGPDGGQKQ